jgi:dATP pyrophosphohydrolase
VVVHTVDQVLLIKRTDHQEFWQSVTGSLEWGESAVDAASRELAEETGICGRSIRNTGIRRSYAIIPEWRYRYACGVLRNYEHLFYCQLDKPCEVQLDPDEHSDFQWLPFQQGIQQAWSWSNKLAIMSLAN